MLSFVVGFQSYFGYMLGTKTLWDVRKVRKWGGSWPMWPTPMVYGPALVHLLWEYMYFAAPIVANKNSKEMMKV